jgi:predicted nuclease of predicted toxin-antitoxin system
MLKFLIDMGVGVNVESWLIANGHDVKTVRALDPKLPDQTILQIAARENRIVVTMDKDFGEMVYRDSYPHAGVLLLRLEAATSSEKIRVVAEIVSQHADKLEGKFSVYKSNHLRIR